MNLKNKVAVIATSAITVTALVLASPALASKGSSTSSKSTPKSTTSATPLPTPPAFGGFGDGDNDGPGGRHGKGRGHDGPRDGKFGTPITKTVTVDVPETGTYQLLVTEVPPAGAPTPPAGAPVRDRSFTVAVTGTGSQTITLNLPHPGDYKVALVSVISTQTITGTATN